MSNLFETTTIKNLQLDNRFVRSGTWLGMAAPDGFCTPQEIDVMAKLAQGGVGLIMAGYAYVQKQGQSAPWMMGCDDDCLLTGLAEMAHTVHRSGGTVALQIAHGGLMARPEVTGQTVLGPSAMPTEQGIVGREMTRDEIQDTVEAFASAAIRATKAGFDGIQIHAAHGYLLSQFLSPFYNRRTDAYGGSLENRARLLMEVVSRVQDAVGDAVPVFVKLNADDLLPGGFSTEDMLGVCAMLEDASIDAIELSGGTIMALLMNKPEGSCSQIGESRLYWLEAAKRYKSSVNVPLMLVGGIRSLEVAEELVADGVADYVSLCRPFLRQPDLVNRWKAGERTEADCISCNACFGPGIQGQGVRCVHV